ncbi:MAG: hypothetical protein ACP5E3_05855 [Bacteroidales bacterium]
MKHILIALLSILFFFSLSGQDKIVINDQSEILNENTEKLLKERLDEKGLEYTKIVDFSDPCSYYFGTLRKVNNEIHLQLRDCNDVMLGKQTMGKSFVSANDEEKAILLSFALMDLREQSPGEEDQFFEEKQAPEPVILMEQDSLEIGSEHNSRYFFAPSAYNLRKGELYYNTVYFLLHDIQYGISDNFSIGMGTTILGIPFYITPKLSIPLSEKSTLAIGDMMILGTWGSDFFGNLLYGMYTRGNSQNNISLGAGWLSTNENNATKSNNSIVFNISGLVRTSTFVYLVTENYGFQLNTMQSAWYENYNEFTGEYITEEFEQKLTIWYGLTGLRFVNKKNGYSSWQFGLSHILNFYEDIPTKYQNDLWYTDGIEGGSRFIAIPTVSYTRKFGKKY